MKRVSSCFVLLVLCTAAWAANGTVFSGEISDSQCALNVHSKTSSHKEMTASHTMGATSAECARTCVKQMGGQYVLMSGGKVYRLDRQELAEKYAGEKVRVKGEVDKKSTSIKVESIEPGG
jgi:Protein of unknown function (DUF5818)